MRVVASHVQLPGGYHLLMGRESVRFQSLVELFWFGIAGATGIALLLGALIGWFIRRALLFEVNEISRTASAIVEGGSSRRLAVRGRSKELDTLARISNGGGACRAKRPVGKRDQFAPRRDALAPEDFEGLGKNESSMRRQRIAPPQRGAVPASRFERRHLDGHPGTGVMFSERAQVLNGLSLASRSDSAQVAHDA
jgi:hypothetical protein